MLPALAGAVRWLAQRTGHHRENILAAFSPAWDQLSNLILLALAKAPQRSDSFAILSANPFGPVGWGTVPNARRRAEISSDSTTSTVFSLSFLTMLSGVPAGAHIPYQELTSKSSKPSSSSVGTSGSN